MSVELVQVSYPPMEPFPDIGPLPDIEKEEAEAKQKREQNHIETYERAEQTYVEAYERKKALLETDSCRLDGCLNTAKAGLKFCRRHLGIRSQMPKSDYKMLGSGTKVRVSEVITKKK